MSEGEITIRLHVATASIMLAGVMETLSAERVVMDPKTWSREWHLRQIERSLKQALLQWPKDSGA